MGDLQATESVERRVATMAAVKAVAMAAHSAVLMVALKVFSLVDYSVLYLDAHLAVRSVALKVEGTVGYSDMLMAAKGAVKLAEWMDVKMEMMSVFHVALMLDALMVVCSVVLLVAMSAVQ